MRRLLFWPLILLLATLVHVDWHFARPTHHRLSLGWSSHWLFAIVVFAAAGWYIARRWPDNRWRAAAWNVAIALFVAQMIEPIGEAVFYRSTLEYVVEPERWTAFWELAAAGLPALVLALWMTKQQRMDSKVL